MRVRLAATLVIALVTTAHAQSSPGFVPGTPLGAAALNAAFVTKLDAAGGVGAGLTLGTTTLNSPIINAAMINSGNLIGTLSGGTLSGTTLVNATFVGSTGTPTQTSVTCGTSSTTLLTASSASAFITVKVPAAASVPVWFNWTGSAAVAAPPSQDVPVGGEIVWSTASGFLPTSAVTCLATSATTVSLLYK